MPDYYALPPEVNYSLLAYGPGIGSLMAAASAHEQLANMYRANSANIASQLLSLAVTWIGINAESMQKAYPKVLEWIEQTALQHDRTAASLTGFAQSYTVTLASMATLYECIANHVLTAVLSGTNFFGVNTPEIIALQVQYIEMWVRNAALEAGYHAAVTGLTAFEPFNIAPLVVTVPSTILDAPFQAIRFSMLAQTGLMNAESIVFKAEAISSQASHAAGEVASQAMDAQSKAQQEAQRQENQAFQREMQASEKIGKTFEQGGQQIGNMLSSAGSGMFSAASGPISAISSLSSVASSPSELVEPLAQAAQMPAQMVSNLSSMGNIGSDASNHLASHNFNGASNVSSSLHRLNTTGTLGAMSARNVPESSSLTNVSSASSGIASSLGLKPPAAPMAKNLSSLGGAGAATTRKVTKVAEESTPVETVKAEEELIEELHLTQLGVVRQPVKIRI